MSEFGFDFEKEGLRDTVSFPAGQQVPLRGWAGIIKEADLFLGCDSVGQHIAYSVGTPVVSVMGSTFGVNVSYPDHEKVDVLDMGEGLRLYDPIRVCPDEESARVNDGIMMMNDKVEEVIMKSVDKLMNRYYTKPEMEIVLPESYGGPQEGCPTCPPEAPLSAPKQQGLGPIELEAASNGVKIPSLEPSKKGFSQTVKVN